MSRTSKADAQVALDEPEIEGRYAELDDYTVAFETHKADIDPAPFFTGLPEDRCQCPHWGFVQSGQIIFRYRDHDEVFTAGDAYYARPGHLPLMFAGTEPQTHTCRPRPDTDSSVKLSNSSTSLWTHSGQSCSFVVRALSMSTTTRPTSSPRTNPSWQSL